MDKRLPCVLLLMVFCYSDVQGQQSGNFIANGKYIRSNKKTCAVASWYQYARLKKIKIEKGPYQVEINREQTRLGKRTGGIVQCTKDSNITFDDYMRIGRTRDSFQIGEFDFIKPIRGLHRAEVTKVPIVDALKSRPAIRWFKEEQWVGLDWISDKAGYARVWWDAITNRSPTPDSLDIKKCDATPLVQPQLDCPEYFNQEESTYSAKRAWTVSGIIRKAVDKSGREWYDLPVRMLNNPDKKLFSIISGDPRQLKDSRKFSFALWANETGGYISFPNSPCTWTTDWTYDNNVRGYSTDQVAWIGRAKLRNWQIKAAEGLEVNLYEGLYPLDGGIPTITMVDSDGFLRGEILPGKVDRPPHKVFFDQKSGEAPESASFVPLKECKGWEDFNDFSQYLSAGGDMTVPGYIYLMVPLMYSLLVKWL